MSRLGTAANGTKTFVSRPMGELIYQAGTIAAAGYGGVKGIQAVAREVASSGKAVKLAEFIHPSTSGKLLKVPDVKTLIESSQEAFKAGQQITHAGRAATKHPEYFGFNTTEELRKVYRSDAQVNQLAQDRINEIIKYGVITTGKSEKYPDGWITYTLPNGNAASWHINGKFIGFRGKKNE